MATALKLRRGTTANHASFTGAEGEVTVDTTKKTAVVHDGSTAGGFALVNESLLRTELAKVASVSTVSWNSSSDTYDITKMQLINAHRNMRRCILNDSGAVVYYLSPTDTTKKADGTNAVLDGTDGQVMVEIPKFYTKFDASGTLKTWSVSDVLLPGYTVHPAFIKDGVEVNARYYSAYDACLWDATDSTYKSGLNYDDNTSNIDTANDKLGSVSGIYPMVGITRAEARLLAAKRGTGWRQLDFTLWSAVQMLYLTEYGNFNSQSKISAGNTRHTSWPSNSGTQTNSRANVAGLSNALGNASGGSATGTINTANNGDYMSYRGIENFFGNVWNWADGCIVNPDGTASAGQGAWWYTNTAADFSDSVRTNMTQITASAPTTSNYASNIADVNNFFVATSVSGGSSTTFLTDYYYGATTADRVVSVGGFASDGAIAGAFLVVANADSSASSRAFGARLAF